MDYKEFEEVTALLHRYVGERDEEYEYDGYSDHDDHFLHFYERRPYIGISERLYKEIEKYMEELIMQSDKEDLIITPLNQVSSKDVKHWSTFLRLDGEGNIIGCECLRFKNCKIKTYPIEDDDDYEPILIGYNSSMAIDRKRQGEIYLIRRRKRIGIDVECSQNNNIPPQSYFLSF